MRKVQPVLREQPVRQAQQVHKVQQVRKALLAPVPPAQAAQSSLLSLPAYRVTYKWMAAVISVGAPSSREDRAHSIA